MLMFGTGTRIHGNRKDPDSPSDHTEAGKKLKIFHAYPLLLVALCTHGKSAARA